MNIVFDEIIIKNFLSIGEATISLDQQGFVQVYGNNNFDNSSSNGSGKSSIFEAILWCLTGSTSRGTRNVKNIYADDGAFVGLHFSVDGVWYDVKRYRDHSKYKNNLFVWVNGEDKSGKGLRESDRILSELLPNLTQEFLSSVMIIGQGMPDRFSSNSPSGRKALLEQLTEQEFVIQHIRDKIAVYSDCLKESINELRGTKSVLSVQEDSLNADIQKIVNELREFSSLEEKEKTLAELDRRIQELDEELALLPSQKENHQSVIRTQQDLVGKLSMQYISTLSEMDGLQSSELAPLTTQLTELEQQDFAIKSKIDEVESLPDICPTCGQRVVNKVDVTEYSIRHADLQKQIALLKDKIKEINNYYSTKKTGFTEYSNSQIDSANAIIKKERMAYDSLDSKERELRGIMEQTKLTANRSREFISSAGSKKSLLDTMLASKQEELEKVISDAKGVTEKLDSLLYKEEMCNTLDSIAKKEYRTYLLCDTVSFLNKICKKYATEVFGTDQLDVVLEDQNIYLSYAGKEYEALSGGEKQKIDLIIQFAIKTLLCEYYGISTNLIVLDEIFDNLDFVGCTKVIDLIINELKDIGSVFIVSHRQDLQIPYDRSIIVNKGLDGVSSITTI